MENRCTPNDIKMVKTRLTYTLNKNNREVVSMGLSGYEGLIAAILALAASLAAFVRQERIKNSQARTTIAEADNKTVTKEGHTDEIIRLIEEVKQLQPLIQRVAILETQLTVVGMYCDLMLLCETCKSTNAGLIAKLSTILPLRPMPPGSPGRREQDKALFSFFEDQQNGGSNA